MFTEQDKGLLLVLPIQFFSLADKYLMASRLTFSFSSPSVSFGAEIKARRLNWYECQEEEKQWR